MINLREQKCVVCRSDTPTLSEKSIEHYLSLIEGWIRVDETIEKTFVFKDFAQALKFFNQVAVIAEAEDHHPDMGIYRWKNVKLSFSTHAAHGLTENDFVMAAKVDQIRSRFT